MDILSSYADLVERWMAGSAHLDIADDIREKEIAFILKSYGKRGRYYHTTDHLRFLFAEFDLCKDIISNPERLFFAIWYHDLIYNVWRKDNELKSAEYAKRKLLEFGENPKIVSGIYTLITATAAHDDPGTDEDDRLFLDMDMAILGSPADEYELYVKNVRREYAAIPAPLFNRGRRQFLQSTLEKPAIFLTADYKKRLDSQARENMTHELSSL